MTVVDSSAIMAILLKEPDAPAFRQAIVDADEPVISAATVIEIGVVMLRRFGPAGRHELDLFLGSEIRVEGVSPSQVQLALDAFAKYGKGMGRKGGLNFGDCFSYALAKSLHAPLLFKGNDFARTDLVPAI